ncbi:hypothetical protein MMC29_000187 [Sticta canariensis]|nr:hypothetical protein [Sticta canariensis]
MQVSKGSAMVLSHRQNFIARCWCRHVLKQTAADDLPQPVNPQQRLVVASSYFIRKLAPANTTILSLFSGTGTDVVAALRAGHDAISIDRCASQVQLVDLDTWTGCLLVLASREPVRCTCIHSQSRHFCGLLAWAYLMADRHLIWMDWQADAMMERVKTMHSKAQAQRQKHSASATADGTLPASKRIRSLSPAIGNKVALVEQTSTVGTGDMAAVTCTNLLPAHDASAF